MDLCRDPEQRCFLVRAISLEMMQRLSSVFLPAVCGKWLMPGFVAVAVTVGVIFLAVGCVAEEPAENGCFASASQWIRQIEEIHRPAVLLRNVGEDCRFSLKWMKQNTGSTGADSRAQVCRDLVLIWTHKKCVYYRDYIDHQTYHPCREWTRQMYDHCMEHDSAWFTR